MKTYLAVFILLSTFSGCQQDLPPQTQPDPDRVAMNLAFFNQSSTAFRGSHLEKLVELWRTETVKDLVHFSVINDQQAYQKAFEGVPTMLPAIDFTRNTLLLGRRGAEYGNGPANIKRISQSFDSINGEWQYKITVTHRSKGGEWFGFTRLVPKITDPSTVKLVMDYQLEP